MSQHSILAPSSAHRRLRCVGSLAASKDIPNPNSIYSAEGTAYHFLAAHCLETNNQADKYLGCKIDVMVDGNAVWAGEEHPSRTEFSFIVDEDNARHTQVYIDAILRIPGEHHFEQRVSTAEVVGVEGQGGTIDAITLDYEHHTIHVDDLKFGRGEMVDAIDNEQLLEYAGGALEKYAFSHDWMYVKVAIHQPRLNHYVEQVYSVDWLNEWISKIKPIEQAAYKLWKNTPSDLTPFLTATDKGCRWCPIRSTCSVRTKKQLAEFPIDEPPKAALHLTLAELGEARDRVDAIEAWCKDIKEEAHVRAMRGDSIPGWKLVEGRMGNRKWDESEAAQAKINEILSNVAPDEKYKPAVLISASDADKILNKKKHPNAEARIAAWDELQALITRAPPGLSLERASVDKPAVSRSMTEFPVQEPTA